MNPAAAGILLRPRVVHRLPGRLRVRLPLLGRLPGEADGARDVLSRLLEVPGGIDRVEMNRHSVTALIHYDAARLTEREVLGFLREVSRLAAGNADRLVAVASGGQTRVEDRLAAWLREQLTYRLQLDGTLRIPDDVLS